VIWRAIQRVIQFPARLRSKQAWHALCYD